ncbi:hypothetical protein EU546_06450, partial [Candidatus Thorarchaeota archaeon]
MASLLLVVLMAGVAPYLGTMTPASSPSVSSEGSATHRTEQGPKKAGHQPLSPAESDSLEGIIDPNLVEQSGYVTSDTMAARTDTDPIPSTSIPLDVENSWTLSSASLDVYNLERLYVVNGTYDEGYPGTNFDPNGTVEYYPLGWDATSNSSNEGQTQVASYEQSTSNHVLVENQGVKIGPSGTKYDHYAGTTIVWRQAMNNTPYTDSFILELSYLYLRGPLGPLAPGNCSIVVAFDDIPVWKQSLVSLSSRGIWYDSGAMSISYPGAPTVFNVTVGLKIDDYLDLNANLDYNNDGVEDGIANTAYITVQIDDFSLVGSDPPSFESVDFAFQASDITAPVTGSNGNGSCSISFEPYYQSNPLITSIHSNSTVRFTYDVRALAHRFLNSTYTTDNTANGVRYEGSAITDIIFETWTYLGFLGDYVNLTLTLYHPSDWGNITVYDPFLNDVTSQCSVREGSVAITGSILTRLGWWEFILDGPNYAQSVRAQKYDWSASSWSASQDYRTGNTTRTQVDIGTLESTPSLDDPVNFTWHLPNGSVWAYESVIPGSPGLANSSAHVFGAENSSAGEYILYASWTNGTEVAIGQALLILTHSSSLEVAVSEIEVTLGEVFSNFVRFRDVETDEYLTEDFISVTGNWTSGTIGFSQNLVRNRFEADFDTLDLEYGITTVNVTAVSLYHDPCSIQFTVVLPYLTMASVSGIGGSSVEADLLAPTSLTLRYQRMDESGIESATFSVYYSGPSDGLQYSEVTNEGIGNYTIEFMATKSGIYEIDVIFSKYAHEDAQTSFLFIIGELGSVLTLLNGTSQSVEYGSTFDLYMKYENTTGYGLENASISVQSTQGDDPIAIGSVSDLGGGLYSVHLDPTETQTFTLVIGASIINHETRYDTFVLTVTEIEMALTYELSSSSIAIGRNITATLHLEDAYSNPVEGAALEFIDAPASAALGPVKDVGLGRYVFNVSFVETGAFVLTVRASIQNYRNSTTAISVVATNIPTSLSTSEGISSAAVEYGSTLNLALLFIRTDLNENVSGASIEVQADDLSALTISVVQSDSA